jgi:hypothetical protein
MGSRSRARRRAGARLTIPYIFGCRSAAFLQKATVASLGLTERHASGCCRADELVSRPSEIHREAAKRGDPRGQNLGFALPPATCRPQPALALSWRYCAQPQRPALFSPSREIFFDSVLRIEKCVLASRTSPSPRLPVNLDRTSRRKAATEPSAIGLRFGSQRCAVSTDGHVYGETTQFRDAP